MENETKYKILYIIFCFAISCMFTACQSNKILSDNGNRIIEYREIESEIRDGETKLAVTGAKLETGLSGLEQSIRYSKTNEQELGEIIQSVRNRELTEDKLIELGIIRN